MTFQMPDELLCCNIFIRYQSSDFGLLGIETLGLDFCDTWIIVNDTIKCLNYEDVRVQVADSALKNHVLSARKEFKLYKDIIVKDNEISSSELHHLIFDFAEKVLLPKLQKNPG